MDLTKTALHRLACVRNSALYPQPAFPSSNESLSVPPEKIPWPTPFSNKRWSQHAHIPGLHMDSIYVCQDKLFIRNRNICRLRLAAFSPLEFEQVG